MDLGGALDRDNYRRDMKSLGRHECPVAFTDIETFAFTHRTMPPTIGALAPAFLALALRGAIQKQAEIHWKQFSGPSSPVPRMTRFFKMTSFPAAFRSCWTRAWALARSC